MSGRLEKILRKEDRKKTSARRNIFNALQKSSTALSAKQIFDFLRKRSKSQVDRASVYRNLSLFVKWGLVHRFQDGTYGICQKNEEHLHNNLHIMAHCVGCGMLEELSEHHEKIHKISEGLQSYIESFSDFSALTLQGLCNRCSSKSSEGHRVGIQETGNAV